MWTAVSNHKQPFIEFLNQKAKILGMEKLGWQDVDAPLLWECKTISLPMTKPVILSLNTLQALDRNLQICKTCFGKSLGRGGRSSK